MGRSPWPRVSCSPSSSRLAFEDKKLITYPFALAPMLYYSCTPHHANGRTPSLAHHWPVSHRWLGGGGFRPWRPGKSRAGQRGLRGLPGLGRWVGQALWEWRASDGCGRRCLPSWVCLLGPWPLSRRAPWTTLRISK